MGDTSDPISKQETYEAFIYLTGSLKFLSDSKVWLMMHCVLLYIVSAT